MPLTPERVATFVRAVGEPVLVMSAAFLLIALASVPLVQTQQAEWPLEPSPQAAKRATEDELLQRLTGIGASRPPEIQKRDGRHWLVLRRLDAERIASVREVLTDAGYSGDEPVLRRTADIEGLLHEDVAKLPVLLSIQALAFLVLGIVLIRLRVRGAPPRAGPLQAGLIGCGAGIAAVLLSVVLGLLLRLAGFPVEEQPWLQEMFSDPAAMIRLAPWIVLLSPIAEEVFFRGYMLRFMSERIGYPAGLVISSLLFALIHFNLSGFVIYVGIGCVLALAYRRTSNILTPIVGHVVTNGIVLVVQAAAPS